MSESEYTSHEELASLTADLRELLEWERFSGATYVEAAPKQRASQGVSQTSQRVPEISNKEPHESRFRPANRPSLIPAVETQQVSTTAALEGADLEAILKGFYACKRCGRSAGVHRVLHGVGSLQADVLLLGDVPDRNEKITGEPFVGRAGKLLNRMLAAIGLKRETVYMCNVAACEESQNGPGEPVTNGLHPAPLFQQLRQLTPKVIVSFGRFEPLSLPESDEGMAELRQELRSLNGIPVVSTYHPAYLLRNPRMKRAAWEDLCKVQELLKT